jgi:hypothetical protein
MRLLPKSLLGAALFAPVAILVSGCSGSHSASGATGDGIAALVACSDVSGFASARCGSVEVPLDRADPSAGTTKVALAVVPRRDRSAPSAGTLVFNPGGPGAPTIVNAGETAKMFGPLLDHRDLLLVDPRGTAPPVTPHAPRRAADLAPVPTTTGTAAQRRALAVVVATATDMQQQASARTAFGTATALRGGRYTTQGQRVRLTSVRVVRDASVSGQLTTAAKEVTGTMHLTGIGTPDGRLRVHLSGTGASRVTGTLDRQPVTFTFRLAA